MKNLLITVAILLCASFAHADNVGVAVPVNQSGGEAGIDYAGAKVAVLASSAVTTGNNLIVSARCVLYGVVVSSANAGGGYVNLFDSTYTVTSTQYLPPVFIENSTKSYTLTFSPPVRFTNGIIARYVAGSGTPSHVSLLYLEK